MDHYQAPLGKPAARLGSWRNPSWWNLLITLPLILGIILSIYQYNSSVKVAARQQTVVGRITAHEAWNHNRYGYSFQIGAHEFSGWEVPMGVEPQIGQEVTVYYDSMDPTRNSLTDFQENSWREVGPVPFEMTGIAVVAFIIALLRRKAARSQALQAFK